MSMLAGTGSALASGREMAIGRLGGAISDPSSRIMARSMAVAQLAHVARASRAI